jgi:hypothetical protein
VAYSRPSWSLGRKIGAVVAFVIGGAVAGASGIMLFSPETPGAFALAPSKNEPVVPTVVAAAPVPEVAPSPAEVKALNVCLRGSPDCEVDAEAAPPETVLDDGNAGKVLAATTPVHGEASKGESAKPGDFMVPRPISSVAPQLALSFTAATVPTMFLASRQIASAPHALVSADLPALAARPKPIVTTAVSLPAAEPPKPEPPKPVAEAPKPRKAVQRRSSNRHYSRDNYRRQQNFFSFFWR